MRNSERVILFLNSDNQAINFVSEYVQFYQFEPFDFIWFISIAKFTYSLHPYVVLSNSSIIQRFQCTEEKVNTKQNAKRKQNQCACEK